MSELTQLGCLCSIGDYIYFSEDNNDSQQVTLEIMSQYEFNRPSVYFVCNKIPKVVFKTFLNAGFVITNFISSATVVWSPQNSILASQLDQSQYISSFDQFNYLLSPTQRSKLFAQANKQQSQIADQGNQEGAQTQNTPQLTKSFVLKSFSRQDAGILDGYRYYFDLQTEELITQQEVWALHEEANVLLSQEQKNGQNQLENPGQSQKSQEAQESVKEFDENLELRRQKLLQKQQFQELSIYLDEKIPLCNGKMFSAHLLLFVPDDLTEEVYVDNSMIIREAEDEFSYEHFASKVYRISHSGDLRIINLNTLNQVSQNKGKENSSECRKNEALDEKMTEKGTSNEFSITFSTYNSRTNESEDLTQRTYKTLQSIQKRAFSSITSLIQLAFKKAGSHTSQNVIISKQFGFYEVEFRFYGDFQPIISNFKQIYTFQDENKVQQRIYQQFLKKGLNYLCIEMPSQLNNSKVLFTLPEGYYQKIFSQKAEIVKMSSESIQQQKEQDQEILLSIQEKENEMLKMKYLQHKIQTVPDKDDSSVSVKQDISDIDKDLINNYIDREFGFSRDYQDNELLDEDKVQFIKQSIQKYKLKQRNNLDNTTINRKFIITSLKEHDYTYLYDCKITSRLLNELFNYKNIPYTITYNQLSQFEQEIAKKIVHRQKMQSMSLLSPCIANVKHFMCQSKSELKRNYFKQLAYIITLQEIKNKNYNK